MNLTQYQIALIIAEDAHFGQTRRDGTPYITHPMRVAETFDYDQVVEKSVAILHDTIEDTIVTEEYLRARNLSDEIVDAVVALTKRKGQSYLQYLVVVKSNPIATKVKIADMIDNLTDAPTEKQKKKYTTGLMFLAGVYK
jgi:(p)ppGpp synthase/HD superfamily hydrolase